MFPMSLNEFSLKYISVFFLGVYMYFNRSLIVLEVEKSVQCSVIARYELSSNSRFQNGVAIFCFINYDTFH